ncbi:MAG: amidohydrolase family protein [Thermodesulfobacteriota bacterium]
MIIDAHVHLGDVLQPDGAGIISQKNPNRKKILNPVIISELLDYRFPWVDRLAARCFPGRITSALLCRSASASLENLTCEMIKNRVAAAVLLPIPPYVTYNGLAGPASGGINLLPFTGIRTDLGSEAPAQLRKDARNGARGLKLHAILQKLPYTDPLTYAVLEEARSLGLPVLFHGGIWSYYLGEDRRRECPGLGAASFARKMVRDFPEIRFITGHSGLMEAEEFALALGGFQNVWMETSFAPPAFIQELLSAFGPDRVLYGSDWPFGPMLPAINAVRRACGKDAALAQRVFSENAREILGLKAVI